MSHTKHLRDFQDAINYMCAAIANGVSKFNKGQRISHNGHIGTILDDNGVNSWYGQREYTVEYDNKNLIPPIMRVPEEALSLYEDINELAEKILKDPPKSAKYCNYCECGAKFTENPNHHSSWCPAR